MMFASYSNPLFANQEVPLDHEGGDIANPFVVLGLGPSILGIGFRLACTVLIRGTPCKTLGSFRNVVDSLAGVRVMIAV